MMNETRQEIEKKVVGILLSPAFGDEASPAVQAVNDGVRPEWFEDDGFAAIFKIIERRVGLGTVQDVDAIAIGTEAKELEHDKKYKRSTGFLLQSNWAKTVAEAVEEAPRASHLEWYVGRLRTLVAEREIQRGVQSALRGFEVDPLAAIAKINAALSAASLTVGGRDAGDLVKKSIANLEAMEEEAWHMRVDPEGPRDLSWIPGFALPWQPLTKLYLGVGGRLHIVAARPSVGKTMFAINLARFWTDQKLKLLFNSLDMPPEDVIDRMRTEKARVSIAKKRFTPTRDNLAELKAASKWIGESATSVANVLYVEDFCLQIAMKKAAGEVDIVIVDYLQLLHSHNVNNANEYERVSYVAEYLKRTANDLGVPIFALSQLNRKGADEEGKEPTLTDLRGSGAIEQAASTILFLHRDQFVVNKWRTEAPPYWYYENIEYGKKCAGENMDAIWAILAKNQNGPTGRLPFVVYKPYFCAKLGDFNAEVTEASAGIGATFRKIADNSRKFARIHRDWRADSWEQQLARGQYPVLLDMPNL